MSLTATTVHHYAALIGVGTVWACFAAPGRLAVLAQWRSTARLAMKVHRSAFVPPPKVMSAVIHIEPAPQPEGVRAATLERLTAAAFGQRRKMLRQSLKSLPGALGTLERLGLKTIGALAGRRPCRRPKRWPVRDRYLHR